MAIKILFINAPLEVYPPSGRCVSYECMPPYGLLYCATICSNILGNESVAVMDAEFLGLSPQQILSEIDRIAPKYIAINATSVNYFTVKGIIALIERKKQVIVGGTHAILSPNDFLDPTIRDKILFVCNGEGESVYHQFFTGIPVDQISNISYFNGKEIIHNRRSNDYPIDRLIVSRDFLPYDPHITENNDVIESYMITSRGCAHKCSFCAANIISQNQIMFRSTEAIVDEFIYLKNRNVNHIRFIDDLFMSSANRLLDICNCIRTVGWDSSNFSFEATGRIDILSKVDSCVWEALAQCGCKELEIGVESGSIKILKQMNKTYSVDDLLGVIKKAVKYNIKIKAYLICGYLNETLEDLLATLNLCRHLKETAGNLIRFSAVPAKAYLKTTLYTQLTNLPCIKDTGEDWLYQTHNINLSEYFYFSDEMIVSILADRTRYNSMHIYNGKIISLSELSGGADTNTVLKVLSDIALISENLSPFFFNNKV